MDKIIAAPIFFLSPSALQASPMGGTNVESTVVCLAPLPFPTAAPELAAINPHSGLGPTAPGVGHGAPKAKHGTSEAERGAQDMEYGARLPTWLRWRGGG